MALRELPDPGFLLPDWVVCRPRLTGICGSDSKQVLMDFGDADPGGPVNPMIDFVSFPQVLGHEVVAEVVELGPASCHASPGTGSQMHAYRAGRCQLRE